MSGTDCNITFFFAHKGLYFPATCSVKRKYDHERKYNSLVVQRMLHYTPTSWHLFDRFDNAYCNSSI